jgi:hypothetical protein
MWPIHGFLPIVTDVPNNRATNKISPDIRFLLTVSDPLVSPQHPD